MKSAYIFPWAAGAGAGTSSQSTGYCTRGRRIQPVRHSSVVRCSQLSEEESQSLQRDSEWSLPTLSSSWEGLWQRPATCRHVEGKPGVVFEPPPQLDDKMLLEICRQQSPDEWVNEIMWTLLGYVRRDDAPADEKGPEAWVATESVPPEWSSDFPDSPPDFIGKRDCFEPEFDRPIKKAVQKLTRSIIKEHKALLKEDLKFEGFTIDQLTPNRTRRSTVVNWILHYQKSHGLR